MEYLYARPKEPRHKPKLRRTYIPGQARLVGVRQGQHHGLPYGVPRVDPLATEESRQSPRIRTVTDVRTADEPVVTVCYPLFAQPDKHLRRVGGESGGALVWERTRKYGGG